MKKLIVIALALVTLQVSAQEKKERIQRGADFTPEEMAQLHTKKMTLELDLTKEQQEQVAALNLENAKAKKTQMEARKNRKKTDEKPSKEEVLKMKNDRLDAQIANKQKMKRILTADQYKKWEELHGKHNNKMKRKRKNEKRRKT